MLTGGPAIILVEPQLGENIGMVARAMGNFGLDKLRIVNPRDGWPNDKAVSAAAGATYVLDDATLHDTLEQSIEDLNYVVATTARQRDGFKPVLGPSQACGMLAMRERQGHQIGILFGRERIGLRNDEVGLADDIVTFPVNPAYASLNIAQAVLLMAYEFMEMRQLPEEGLPFAGPQFQSATKNELFGLFSQLENALRKRGYFRPSEREPAMLDALRAVLTRPGFTALEVRVLRGVVSSLDRFSPDKPRGSGAPDE